VLLPTVTGNGTEVIGAERRFCRHLFSYLAANQFLGIDDWLADWLSLLLAGVAAPAGESPDCDENCEADAEVDNYPEIILVNVPCGWRQIRHDEEVHDIPRQHGDKRLCEIHRCWF
jgi:hypothetical protein